MGKNHVRKEMKTNKKKSVITVEEVVDLGGEEKDLELIEDVEDSAEELECGEDFESEPIKRDEIRNFIKSLGFDEVMESNDEEKPKKKKLLVSKEIEAENEEEPSTSDSKKSKKKNKFKSSEEIQSDEVSSSTNLDQKMDFLNEPIATRTGLLVKTTGDWKQYLTESGTAVLENSTVSQFSTYCEKLMEHEVSLFKKEQDRRKKGDIAWIRTVISSGTLTDRIAAYTLLVQESPVHNLQSLEKLVEMVDKKKKRECVVALDALKELFVSDLLPDDRKLLTLKQRPLNDVETLASGNKDSRDRRLIVWYYEDQLKILYSQFCKAIQELCHDTVSANRKKAISAVHYLLSSKPEQEKELLGMLINKLGDPDFKTASKCSYLLSQLVEVHPNMKHVVVAEVERMIFRPNISSKAQYYAVCFMTQLVLSHSDSSLASKLINIFFSLFNSFVKKGDVDSKMLRALLTGVNRAYPYAKVERNKIEERMNTLYKVVHVTNFHTSIQALQLLFQVTDDSESVSERFYTALYRKLVDPALGASPKQAVFLNLIYKSMLKDTQLSRVKAFCKRLLQICCSLTVPFVCGTLVMISELLKKRPELLCISKRELSSDDEDDEHFVDASDDEQESSENDEEEKQDSSDKQKEMELALKVKGHTTASWVHRNNTTSGKRSVCDYDLLHRNPLYCHADSECVWELKKLSQHYHPTVSLFAQNLLEGKKISYTGDPLNDFTLINFLNRFVYRNPKKTQGKQPLSSKFSHAKSQKKKLPVNSSEYIEQGEDKIPVDEKFLFKYFSEQAEKKAAARVNDEDSDAGSVEDDEFDDYLEKFEKNLTGDDDLNFDFASELGKPSSKKKKNNAADDEDGESDDDMDDLTDEEVEFSDDLMDEEMNFSDEDDDEDPSDVEEGFDEEDIAFSDDDEAPQTSKRSLDSLDFSSGGKKKKKQKQDSLFAAAEDFAHLMDDNAGDMIGTSAMANTDNASAKQLKWESDRDKWIKGKSWKQQKQKKKRRK